MGRDYYNRASLRVRVKFIIIQGICIHVYIYLHVKTSNLNIKITRSIFFNKMKMFIQKINK